MKQSIRMATMIFILVALGLGLAGVAVAQAQIIDSCTLLGKNDIKAALGQNVSDGKVNTKANPGVALPCEYEVGSGGSFSVAVKTASPGETPDKVMAEYKKLKLSTSEAPGIGDRSFFSNPGHGMLQLNTFKGSKYVVITMWVSGSNEAAQKAAMEKLMRKALTKI